MSVFQIISLAVSGFLLVGGIIIFALYGGAGGNSSNVVGPVVVWGTVDTGVMGTLLDNLRQTDKTFQGVTYVQKKTTTYKDDLINALASGTGPDLFLVSQSDVVSFSDKLTTIPYTATPQASFESSFIDEAQLFETPQGLLAMPFTVDPLVMYWNKNLFASAGVAQPPRYWKEFLPLAPKITSIDAGSTVHRSAVALGEWSNIRHAKDILSTLFIQAGDTIVARQADGSLTTTFNTASAGNGTSQAESALLFYSEFADPAKTTYSWNRSLPNSFSAFVAGDLAVYMGLASDYRLLLAANPNLSFGVALLPQIEGNSVHATFGEMNALAVARNAKNPQGALTVALALAGAPAQTALLEQTGLPTVRRDLVIDTSNNAAGAVFVQSALISRGWLDPNPSLTDPLFEGMVESVLSGKGTPATSVSEAAQALSQVVHPVHDTIQ